jgi:hypothetical protein
MKLLSYRPVAEPGTALALTTPCSKETQSLREALWRLYLGMAIYPRLRVAVPLEPQLADVFSPMCQYEERWSRPQVICVIHGGPL